MTAAPGPQVTQPRRSPQPRPARLWRREASLLFSAPTRASASASTVNLKSSFRNYDRTCAPNALESFPKKGEEERGESLLTNVPQTCRPHCCPLFSPPLA